jgi:hypothetical protein
MRIPGHRRTIIVLGNLERLGRTVRDLAAIMRGQPVVTPRARNLLAADSLREARHAGVYRTETGDSVEVSMDGPTLVAYWREHFRAALFAESPEDYFVAQLNATARFRERDGQVELVIEDGLGKVVVKGIRQDSSLRSE